MAQALERGSISLGNLAGGLDLQATLESGQTYLWWREDGGSYDDPAPAGGDAWYRTTARDPATGDLGVIRARQVDARLQWEATVDAEGVLRRRLRLDDDLHAIRAEAPASDDRIARAYDEYWGMRLVEEPVFPTLVTFICSAQMRVERIHEMQQSLRAAFGEPVVYRGDTHRAYPTPEAIAASSEDRLRELGLGYRAPYVLATARMIVDGEADPAHARELPYERARDYLTRFVGVGDKVADCVLLFALDFLEAVPLDTWIRKGIAAFYPDCDRGNYAETSVAIRKRLGGRYAGYAQTYLFHFLRHAEDAGLD